MAVLWAVFWAGFASSRAEPVLIEERFEEEPPSLEWTTSGDASRVLFEPADTAHHCIRLNSATDQNKDKAKEGSVVLRVREIQNQGKWFRFTFRGLPARDFRVAEERDLFMQVRFYAEGGRTSLDGVVKEIYPQVLRDRRDIEANGNGGDYGSVAWPRYAFDFSLPFPEIDTVELAVGFRNGLGEEPYGSFFVDEMKLEAIPPPAGAKPVVAEETPAPAEGRLVPLGGRWHYLQPPDEQGPPPRRFDASNASRLVYLEGTRRTTPFSGNLSSWLRRGNLDREGVLVQEDRPVPDAVVVELTADALVIRSRDLPNHPTAIFPGYLGNRSYIQEQDFVFHLPLEPKVNPRAVAMKSGNENRALNMGAIGVATNGVLFYNPFDGGMKPAVDIMDRCCGHPDPGNRYHYHKYPVCIRSPFEDDGSRHSPVIGWALDGFPIYGPYEAKDVMAKDSKENPLNAFNVHYDEDRGWHYHATPGQFPYIIGGYWGFINARNTGLQSGVVPFVPNGGPERKRRPGR